MVKLLTQASSFYLISVGDIAINNVYDSLLSSVSPEECQKRKLQVPLSPCSFML